MLYISITNQQPDNRLYNNRHEMNDTIRISDIDRYTIQIIEGSLVLTLKEVNNTCDAVDEPRLSEEDFLETNFKGSKIVSCVIKNRKGDIVSDDKNKYRPLLIDIWSSTPLTLFRLNTSFKLRFIKEEAVTDGFNWCPEIKCSFQSKDSKGTIIEILNMVRLNEFTIDINIRLKNGEEVKYKNY